MGVFALITGGASGLGKELALRCAAHGFHLILVALPGGNAESLAEQIRMEYGVRVVVFEFDITDHPLLLRRLEHIHRNYPVSLLVNNAGIGGTACMTDTSSDLIDKIIQVNVRATALITRIMLPQLLKAETGYIMNIASMAAFTPIAYKTVYPASKAFVSSFSLGLREELRHTNVSVSVVYPGAIMTNSDTSRRIIFQGAKARFGLLPTSEIARIALKQTLAKKAIIVPGRWNRLNRGLLGLLPLGARLRIASDTIRHELRYKE